MTISFAKTIGISMAWSGWGRIVMKEKSYCPSES
jgi:hypothetical protein